MSVLLDGLDELRLALHDMPDALTNAALEIVATAAADTAAEVKTVYPTAAMRDAVVVSDRSEPYKARVVVESRTPQAHWWEWGTENRHTQQGWNRGSEPAHPDRGLVGIAKRHRRMRLR